MSMMATQAWPGSPRGALKARVILREVSLVKVRTGSDGRGDRI
jgi:hypothetical protein